MAAYRINAHQRNGNKRNQQCGGNDNVCININRSVTSISNIVAWHLLASSGSWRSAVSSRARAGA